MNSSPMIASTKIVYSNELFDIFIATNNQQPESIPSVKTSYVYFKGEFYSMAPAGNHPCSRPQTEFLLSVMTKFGNF
jgi:hypothetical protein